MNEDFESPIKIIHIDDSKGSDDEVYIGREGNGKSGYFGNPIIRGEQCPQCGKAHSAKGSTLKCYEKYLVQRIRKDKEFRDRLKGLKGKILVCFCRDTSKCHGSVLASYANRL